MQRLLRRLACSPRPPLRQRASLRGGFPNAPASCCVHKQFATATKAISGQDDRQEQETTRRSGRRKKKVSIEAEKLGTALFSAKSVEDVFSGMKRYRASLTEDANSVCASIHRLGRLASAAGGDPSATEKLQLAMVGLGRILETPEMFEQCEHRILANVMWSFAKNGVHVDDLFARVVQRFSSRQEVNQLSPQAAANVLWAYAVLGIGNGTSSLMLVKRLASKKTIATSSPQNIANSLWAMGKIMQEGRARDETGKAISIKQFLLPVQKLLARLLEPEVLAKAAPKSIADTLLGVATMETAKGGSKRKPKFDGPPDWVMQLLEQLLKPKMRSSCTPKDLANASWAAARLIWVLEEVPPHILEAKSTKGLVPIRTVPRKRIEQGTSILAGRFHKLSQTGSVPEGDLGNFNWALRTLNNTGGLRGVKGSVNATEAVNATDAVNAANSASAAKPTDAAELERRTTMSMRQDKKAAVSSLSA